MSGRNEDYRRYYSTRRRGGREFDYIAAAMAAQILLCGAALFILGALKEIDPQGYARFKAEYTVMISSEAQGSLLNAGDGFGEGILAPVERAISGVLGRIAGIEETEPLKAEGESNMEEQEPPVEMAQELQYDYLDPPAALSGAGGWNPIDADMAHALQVPEDATLAPVYLAGRIITPVEGTVTSRFAYREHPVSGNPDFHNGIDIAAEEGRGILAALPGEVVEIGDSDIYGNYVIVKHSESLSTFYAHCSLIIAQEGMQVRQGERIAKVGQTGVATGPHLHFSVLVNELYTDPLWLLGDSIEILE